MVRAVPGNPPANPTSDLHAGGQSQSCRDWGGVKAEISEIATDEPSQTGLESDQHVLLGTLAGGTPLVEVRADGTADWRGLKMPGAAGFFPGGRRMRSRWPIMRLTYFKLSIVPGATEALLHHAESGIGWQTRSSAEDPFISATLVRLAAALAADPGDRLASLTAETLATALHLHLVARFSDLRLSSEVPQEGLARVLDLIHESLPLGVSLDELVAASGLPRARFLAAFARQTGHSPHRYVLRERMARARHLLETTRVPVGEVARAVGCANAGHLTRLYRGHYDTTPLSWRQRHGRS